MRLDDYLSTVGMIKRRTVAKELAQKGLVHVNERRAKPAYQIKLNDIIAIRGTHPVTVEVVGIPTGSVPKERREEFFGILPTEQ
ncbi:MAG: S4 domain-containing protein [candidate division Zixibacteria bacterium]|nr:S4 domain-containing protein [candidate division Zixibacteria bacterium]